MTASADSIAGLAAPRRRALAGLRVRNPALVLAGLVALSFLVRLGIAWMRRTPLIFPDEYIYAELGRSFAETGLPLVRGHAAHFPALLQPLLTAPAWLVSDVATAYRIVQALQALAMSLAAVPVFLLARRLRLAPGVALAVAALTLAVPDFVYAAGVLGEGFAYPLALGAVAAGVAALERPGRRAQVAFVALTLLATLTRIQFVVLAVAYVAAVLALGLAERRLRAAISEQRLPLGLFAAAGVVLGVVGLGYYSAVLDDELDVGALLSSTGENLFVFAFAAGWVLVPGALIGLWLALRSPLSRAERAFAALAVALTACLFVEAAVYGPVPHERYTFYAVPLAATAFALYARRGWPHRLPHTLLAAVLVTCATLWPLSDFGERGEVHAPSLIAVHWLTLHVGSPGTSSLIVLAVVVASTGAVVGLSLLPRAATVAVFVLAGALMLTGYGLCANFLQRSSERTVGGRLASDPSFVDAHHLGPVAFVAGWGDDKIDVLNYLFWNRSVDRVLLLPGARKVDVFDAAELRVAADGTLTARGETVRGPLLVDAYASYIRLRGAHVLDTSPNYDLWVPDGGTPRLALYLAGRYRDGWVAPRARLDVWARHPGTLTLPLLVPSDGLRTTLRIELPGRKQRSYQLVPGKRLVLSLPVCRTGNWHVLLAFEQSGVSLGRLVSARSGTPRLTPGAAGCPAA